MAMELLKRAAALQTLRVRFWFRCMLTLRAVGLIGSRAYLWCYARLLEAARPRA